MPTEAQIVERLKRQHGAHAAIVVGSRAEGVPTHDAQALIDRAQSSAHRYWYEIKHGRFSQSVHRALPEIAACDPVFHADLLVLASTASADARIAAAQRLQRDLFGSRT